MTDRVTIRRMATGVPGLDDILGGGLPEFSFNLIAGAPGAGKTTLAQQIMFALAVNGRQAVYFSVLGEPPLKMLRYQQQFRFFDLKKVNESVRFVNLGREARTGRLPSVLKRITDEVESRSPAIVVVDSFRSIVHAADRNESLQDFVQELGMRLTGWEATTFLVGEYQLQESQDNPVFTVADGLFWLFQHVDRNSVVRKMQIAKMRGQATVPGLHTFRITEEGVHVFPRMILESGARPVERRPPAGERPRARLSTGVPPLDEMLGGGVPAGFSMLVAGPSGSGKTVLATQFITEGARQGENGIIAAFEKHPDEYAQVGVAGFHDFIREGRIRVLHTRPLDLSIDETLHELTSAIDSARATRVVIDSLSGFELALAPTFREDFRESLYRMVAILTGKGVTVLMTAQLEDAYTMLRLSPHDTAFLADAVVLQRYVEIEGRLRRLMTVIKVRGSVHSQDLRLFDVSGDGIDVGPVLDGYEGLLTGSPTARAGPADRPAPRGARETR